MRCLGGEVGRRVLDEQRVADVADLGGPSGGPARHRLSDAVRAEDAAAVAAVVLPSVRRQGRLAVLARRHVVLVLPPNLGRQIRGGCQNQSTQLRSMGHPVLCCQVGTGKGFRQ